MYFLKATLSSVLFSLLLGHAAVTIAETPQKHAGKTLVMDIQITGDSSVTGDKAENLAKITHFSDHLRKELNDKTRFDVITDKNALEKITELSRQEDLDYCNGCELDLAKSAGAELVMLPKVFRMSHLISTLHIEVKDVETGKLIKKKAFDFRGNTDQHWERAIKYAVRDLKDYQP